MEQVRRNSQAPSLRRFWIALFAVPALFVAIDTAGRMARYLGYLTPAQDFALSVSRDHSFAEIAGFIELLGAVVLLFSASRRLKDAKLMVMAGLILYMLCDDFFLLHDTARPLIGTAVFPEYEFALQTELGEMIYFSSATVLIFAILFLTCRKASREQIYRILMVLVGIVIYACFAIIIDAMGALMHYFAMISDSTLRSFSVVEDAGELFASGLIFLTALVLYRMGGLSGPDHGAPRVTD